MFFPLKEYIKNNLVRANGISKGPTLVDMELTNRCNLRCGMCWFHGENGVGDRYQHSEMTTKEVLEFIDQLAVYNPFIYFGGAEPFIREDFLTILARVKQSGLTTAFTTNGTLMDQEKVRNVVELGVDKINVSIDGPEVPHDTLRGHGSFGKLISNIRHLLKCRQEKNAKKPLITINITLNHLIVGRLKETVDSMKMAVGDGVDLYRIHHLWFITPRELRRRHGAINDALGVSAPGSDSHCITLSNRMDITLLSREISELRGKGKIGFLPDLRGKEVQKYYSEGYRPGKRCVAPFRAVLVKPNGDVKFCPDEWIDDYILGNIREERFEKIWNNPKAAQFRTVIKSKRSFPGCKRCSWMHSF